MKWAYTGKRQPSEHDIPRRVTDLSASEHTCMAYPEGYKLRPEQPAMMACVEPKGHAGQHRNRLGGTWAMARRPRLSERVEERRHASW